MSDELRYPTGRFHPSNNFTAESRRRALDAIAALPTELRAAVAGLDEARLDMPYRDGGWTVRQVVHHLPDSHVNAYVRHKLAATEELPTIKPYHEARWAELADGRGGDVEVSLRLLEALHERWSRFLAALAPADFARAFRHPEMPGKTLSLDFSVEMYAWHGRHHVGHVTALRARNGW